MTTIKFLSVCYISTLYYTNIDHFPREIPLTNRKLKKRKWNICNVAHFAFVVDNMVVCDRIIWNIGINIWGSVLRLVNRTMDLIIDVLFVSLP